MSDSSEDEDAFVNFCTSSKRSHEEVNSSISENLPACDVTTNSESGQNCRRLSVAPNKRRRQGTAQDEEIVAGSTFPLREINRPAPFEISEEVIDNYESLTANAELVTPNYRKRNNGGRPAGSKNKNPKPKTPKKSSSSATAAASAVETEASKVQKAEAEAEFNLEEWTKLINARNSIEFKKKLDAIDADKMSAINIHKLILTCIDMNKVANLKFLFSNGYRLILDPPSGTVIALYVRTIVESRIDFLTSTLLDIDPAGTIKLIAMSHQEFPDSKILEKFQIYLEKADFSVDPEAIQLAAETAAEIKSLEIFQILYESDLMIRMIPTEKLLTLLTTTNVKDKEFYITLLTRLNDERTLCAPFELNILSMAALKGDYDFLDVVEPHLKLFPWDIVIQAITLALKNGNLSFAEILLRTNNFSNCNFLFRLVQLDEFIAVLAKYANSEILNRIIYAVFWDGRNIILSNFSLLRLFYKSAEMGNIDAIDYFIRNGIFVIGTRFEGKSIFRTALERKQFTLAKYMIKMLSYSIYDSDTYTVNPHELGGDSLIYVAENSSHEMFSYLLRLGANPNVLVLDDEGHLINLVYWCIMKGQHLLVIELFKYNCQFDFNLAVSFNTHPEKQFLMSELIHEYFLKSQQK